MRAWLPALVLGCTPGDASPGFEADVRPLLDERCVVCHAGELPDGELDLAVDPYDALVEAPSAQANLLLVAPGDHLYSYLWHKLEGTQSVAGGAGTGMPIGDPLQPEDIDRIRDWIDGGALP